MGITSKNPAAIVAAGFAVMRQVYSSANRMSIAAHCAPGGGALRHEGGVGHAGDDALLDSQDIAVDAQSLTLALSVNFARL